MDFDENLELLAEHRYLQWLDLLQTKQAQIPAWATSLHPQRLSCGIVLPTLYGSYNFGIPIAFSNGEKWFVRFPLFGKTSAEHLDEKVASEVTALKLLRARTDIPVPEVKAWATADYGCQHDGLFVRGKRSRYYAAAIPSLSVPFLLSVNGKCSPITPRIVYYRGVL